MRYFPFVLLVLTGCVPMIMTGCSGKTEVSGGIRIADAAETKKKRPDVKIVNLSEGSGFRFHSVYEITTKDAKCYYITGSEKAAISCRWKSAGLFEN